MQAVHLNLFRLLTNAIIRRGTHGDVVGDDAFKIKIFLHSNTNGCTAAPDTDNKVWAKAIFEHLIGESKGVDQQLL